MSQCREALTTRQKLIAQDYKVSYSLAKACKSDLRKYRCSMDTNLPRAREARLSYLLLCLESAVHRGDALSSSPSPPSSSSSTSFLLFLLFLLLLFLLLLPRPPPALLSPLSPPPSSSSSSFLLLLLSSLH